LIHVIFIIIGTIALSCWRYLFAHINRFIATNATSWMAVVHFEKSLGMNFNKIKMSSYKVSPIENYIVLS